MFGAKKYKLENLPVNKLLVVSTKYATAAEPALHISLVQLKMDLEGTLVYMPR